MMKASLKINGERDFTIEDDLVTIGRASDNKISFAEDSNVSRYHAEIENRDGEYWLIELGSSNGTTVNGEPLETEILLQDGDRVLLGGTSEIEFRLEEEKQEETEEKSASAAAPSVNVGTPNLSLGSAGAAVAPADAPKMSALFIVMGLACGLAIISVGAVVLYSAGVFSEAKCEAKAVITSPASGELIDKETEVTVEAENAECVRRAVFLLNDVEIASADAAPYTTTLDPKQFPELADGGNHSLKVVLEDEKGNRLAPSEILLAFETAEIPTPTPTPVEEETPVPTDTPKTTGKQASPIEIKDMADRLLKQFSGGFRYKFDQQFLLEVQKKIPEYAAAEGYFARADKYRDVINFEFHKANGLDAPLGFMLAMSRSKFNVQRQGADEGLWQLSNDFVTTNGYKTACEAESLSDPLQNCAAKTSSIYLKALAVGVFEGDVVYTAAAFGMSPQDASIWKSSLPADRADFWKTIRDARQREQVVRFFAAGIVAENPQRFGLKKDRPISELYRNLIGN